MANKKSISSCIRMVDRELKNLKNKLTKTELTKAKKNLKRLCK